LLLPISFFSYNAQLEGLAWSASVMPVPLEAVVSCLYES
jgi:hypothetical protein